MTRKTSDLCDDYTDSIQVAEPVFGDFGGLTEFSGIIHTLKVFEDNSLVRQALQSPGDGKVLVVDGGGSLRCALVGGNLAALGVKNGWHGIIVNGCVRDSAEMAEQTIGVKALATHPLKSVKKGVGDEGINVHFCHVTFRSGEYVYADEDGIVVLKNAAS